MSREVKTKTTKNAKPTEKKVTAKTNTKGATKATKETAAKKTTPKFGLGKGIDSLIPIDNEEIIKKEKNEKKTTEKENAAALNGYVTININDIEPNPNQPRRKFDEDALGELAESIKQHGLIQPIIVQKTDKIYQIVAGERRWRACRLAKLKEVPVIIKDLSKSEQYEIALIENIQREDLNDIEEAMAYKSLIEEFNLKQDELAERVSKSRVVITNSLRLLKLDKRVQDLVVNGLITGGHARSLLGISDGNLQYDMATRIIDERLSVRETEKLVKSLLNRTIKVSRRPIENDAVYNDYENNLRSILGSKVEIKQNGQNKGRIIIEFNSTDEFERVYDIIKR